ncbi:MAG: c-type cytochrome biogenesis protein CcsB [Syntrophales bacterium]|nr:c-type cytochrome biogenesis protein CcsB [Syntrophales bacterium]
MDTVILSLVTFIYFAAFVFYLLGLIFERGNLAKIASFTAMAGLLAQTAALVIRWKSSYDLGIGHAPMSNFYESLIFFAWTVVLLYLVIEWRIKNRILGVFVLPVSFLLMAFASISPNVNSGIQPLIPALQSNWLTSHVLTCFLGYASFTVAFALGIIYFLKRWMGEREKSGKGIARLIPGEEVIDELMYQSVVLGFVFLTLGIVTGSVWAHYAWGSYWSWDPKETWSLITWMVYAAMLHARFVRGWRGRRMAVMAIVGFASVLFTYLGVNYLPGLHSYLQS